MKTTIELKNKLIGLRSALIDIKRNGQTDSEENFQNLLSDAIEQLDDLEAELKKLKILIP